MTKYEDALNILCFKCSNSELCEDTGCFSKKLMQELVELHQPTKPNYNSIEDEITCPNCCNNLSNFKFNFCPRCGQMLDWSYYDE